MSELGPALQSAKIVKQDKTVAFTYLLIVSERNGCISISNLSVFRWM